MNLPPAPTRYRVRLNQPVPAGGQIEIAGIHIRLNAWTEFQQTDIQTDTPFHNLVDLLCDDRLDLETFWGGAWKPISTHVPQSVAERVHSERLAEHLLTEDTAKAGGTEKDRATFLRELSEWLRKRLEPNRGHAVGHAEAAHHLVAHEHLSRSETLKVLTDAGYSDVDKVNLPTHIKNGRRRVGSCRICPPFGS